MKLCINNKIQLCITINLFLFVIVPMLSISSGFLVYVIYNNK